MFVTNIKVPKFKSTKPTYANVELIQLAKEKDFYLPNSYSMSQIDERKLLNDFDKFKRHKAWYPDYYALDKTQVIFERLYREDLKCESKSFDEAIEDMQKSKSPGYPYNLKFKTKGKLVESPEALLDLRNKVEKVFSGEYVETIHLSSPKIEIRPKSKLKNDDPTKEKVRVFMCCDILMYVVATMLYSNQNKKLLYRGDSNHWSAVGLSVFKGQWHNTAMRLTGGVLDKLMHCFDINAMEASISAAIFQIIYHARNMNILDPNRVTFEAQKWYFTNLLFPKILTIDDFIAFMVSMNPSGQLNTLDDNTMGLVIGCLYHLAKERSVEQVIALYETTTIKLLGDDSIIPDHPMWNGFIASMAELGFTMAYECPPCPIYQAKFLNFSWTYDPVNTMFIPRPNFEKIFSNLYMNFKRKSWRLAFVKLAAMKTLVWPFVQYNQLCEYYMSYILSNHDYDMRIEHNVDELITYLSTRSQELTRDQLESLTYGY